MSIMSDVQQLNPGTMLAFYILDSGDIGGGVVRFHGIQGMQDVTWQGLVYSPWPIETEGFDRTSDQQPVPKLRVGNIDGSISLLCQTYDDLVGAKLTRHRTFYRYLDAVNFTEGNPTADPTQEFPPDIWFLERKSIETREMVEWELSSALDLNGVKLPRRQIVANFCPWQYRDENCNYTGPAVAKLDDTPTTDPALDKCGRRLTSCKKRVWPGGILNYGGFPAAGLLRV